LVRHHDIRHEIAPTSPPNSRMPGDRYVVNGVILSEHAYSARQLPLQDWLTKFAFTPEKAAESRKMGSLEQNRAS
jgi:hypothetical protein